jgi:hypothetical protein
MLKAMELDDLCFNTNCTNNATYQCQRCYKLFCHKCLTKIDFVLICLKCLAYIVKREVDVPMRDRDL